MNQDKRLTAIMAVVFFVSFAAMLALLLRVQQQERRIKLLESPPAEAQRKPMQKMPLK